jgi:hypothetical protein
MFFAQSHLDLHNIRLTVERTKKLSDRVIGIGPWGLGLDGVLAWIPGAGQAFSVIAGLVLMVQAVRARASAPTLLSMAGILLADSAMSTVPVLGSAADMLFTGHKWSADLLLRHLDETVYVEGGRDQAAADDWLTKVRRGEERRRIVFLPGRFPLAGKAG